MNGGSATTPRLRLVPPMEHANVVQLRQDQLRTRTRVMAPLALARIQLKEVIKQLEIQGNSEAKFAAIRIIAEMDALYDSIDGGEAA